MGLSVIAMGFAAFGYIAPVAGALLQEAIDLGVILNALRALRPGPARALRLSRAGRGRHDVPPPGDPPGEAGARAWTPSASEPYDRD